MSGDKVLVPLAQGFEEIEAVTIIDVLRRAEVEVVVAGLEEGSVTGAHGIAITPDTTIDACRPEEFRMIALPGGMPGAAHLRDDARVQGFIRQVREQGGTLAAICAAPIALGAAGVTEERTVTSYPGFREQVPCASYVEDRAVVDGGLITSRGPGTALEFALTLVERLVGTEKSDGLEEAMLVHRHGRAKVVS